MIPTLTFDIETVPDVAGLRLLRDTPSQWSDAEVAEAAFAARREATGSDFLPLHLHRVVAISVALRERDSFRVWSLGEPGDAEGELIQRFFDGVERYTPQLVSWNGGGFDLPVLHYRGLVHGVRAARYWDLGEDDRDFRYSNYIGRYHTRHVDLMDLLAKYQPRASAPLDELARLVGLPGKIGMEGSRVWQAWQEERIEEIRAYCEADV
ncbi:MAG: 3'-5' exonuclease, partial [Betaproteobacteria bacterium]